MCSLLAIAVEKLEDTGAMIILGDAVLTIIIGVVVVFAVLLLLTGVFKLFGMVMSGNKKVNTVPDASVDSTAVTPAASTVAPIVGNTQPVTATQEIQNGISAETVAAISAAVASVASAGTQYAVKSIRKM